MNRDASMLDEGLAREVVNLVQKLRKKGQLVPTDPITVLYKITPEDSDLASVVTAQKAYIENLLKVPLRSWSPSNENSEFVVEESSQVRFIFFDLSSFSRKNFFKINVLLQLKGSPALIQLKIIRGFCSDWSKSDPSSNKCSGSVESIKRKSTTPSTQAAKVVKSDVVEKPREMNPQMKSRERERKKSQSKEFRRSLPQPSEESPANGDSSLIKISNGHFSMTPWVR